MICSGSSCFVAIFDGNVQTETYEFDSQHTKVNERLEGSYRKRGMHLNIFKDRNGKKVTSEAQQETPA